MATPALPTACGKTSVFAQPESGGGVSSVSLCASRSTSPPKLYAGASRIGGGSVEVRRGGDRRLSGALCVNHNNTGDAARCRPVNRQGTVVRLSGFERPLACSPCCNELFSRVEAHRMTNSSIAVSSVSTQSLFSRFFAFVCPPPPRAPT